MNNEDSKRFNKSIEHLKRVIATKPTVYTLGLLMGILARTSIKDYDLYEELRQLAKDCDNG